MAHPMRRKDREMTDHAEMDEVLDKALVGHLGLCDEGVPYVLPMNFALLNGALYLHCAQEGRKLDVIGKNSRACFSTETDMELVTSPRACGWGMTYRSVLLFGTISVVESEKEKGESMMALMKKCAGPDFSHVFTPPELASVTVLRLDWDERTGKARYPA
ncbi:MAG: pyridoxamine 5'-phosphate oxidase family protein [Synergistaceae bacterium]|nr:pyridoxamine 5'-phosphate oxidase family protein [Synergistaceae bacterium]